MIEFGPTNPHKTRSENILLIIYVIFIILVTIQWHTTQNAMIYFNPVRIAAKCVCVFLDIHCLLSCVLAVTKAPADQLITNWCKERNYYFNARRKENVWGSGIIKYEFRQFKIIWIWTIAQESLHPIRSERMTHSNKYFPESLSSVSGRSIQTFMRTLTEEIAGNPMVNSRDSLLDLRLFPNSEEK